MVNIAALEELTDWMRKRGASRVRMRTVPRAGFAQAIGEEFEIEVELRAHDPNIPAPPPKSKEQVASDLKETRRRRYELELGRRLSDQELDRLP